MNYNSYTKFLGHYSKSNILEELLYNLNECDEFFFSVSFIKETGLVLLESAIEKALRRGVKGTIVTSGYLNITQVESLKKIHKLSQIYSNLKVFFIKIDENSVYKSFHTKGYLFLKDNDATVIIGSSNMSGTALTSSGGEWSLESKTDKSNELFVETINDFNHNVSKSCNVLTEEIIKEYDSSLIALEYNNVPPNFMQEEALKALIQTRKNGANRALIVAAMASGKTYLSAFDAKAAKANRILYVCHTENILNGAYEQFYHVFGQEKTYGYFIGKARDKDADIIFATNQSLSKHIEDFKKDTFDYIIIDEAHHAPAKTYLIIINYFQPDFLLGLTGTPDRLDLKDVKSIFGNTIPYELSLRDAIKLKLIMPFKYYSISDDFVDYSRNETKINLTGFIKDMTNDKHGLFIKQQIEKHKTELGCKIKCLAFCINIEHAKKMSALMNKMGYVSACITKDVSPRDRGVLFDRLQSENDNLQIICSVDTMNEGVDLPYANMALFLRPTESSTIFIQQLGRSLRKKEGKSKPVIIDFIGKKYERSAYIAWALGTLTEAPVMTKPILKQVLNGKTTVESELGVEIYFDEKSKKEIDEYIDKTNFNKDSILKSNYDEFKKYYNLLTFPKHIDFVSKSSGFDLLRIIKNKSYRSYYNFLIKFELNVPKFNELERKFIEYISGMLPLTRPYEFLILHILINEGENSYEDLKKKVNNSVNQFNEKSFAHALEFLQRMHDTNDKKNDYKYVVFDDDYYKVNYKMKDLTMTENEAYIEIDLNNSEFKSFINDILNYGLTRFSNEFKGSGNEFELYRTYSRAEYKRVSNCRFVDDFQQGVFYPDSNDSVAIFIDMVKDKDVEEHLNYGDRFITKEKFEWESQTETVIGNLKYTKLVSHVVADVFVRKFKKEDGINLPYVYLGKGKFTNPRKTANKKQSVLFDIILENKLPDNLFEQFNIDDK